jgi:hypothetical protein
MLLKEKWKEAYKWRKDEEEDASNYCMTLRKRKDIGNWKWKHYITLYGEVALEKTVDMS